MRFLVDAQLPPALAAKLRTIGHEAEHVNEIGLGAATDLQIWGYAFTHQAVVVSKDSDFADLAIGEAGSVSVVWIRLGNTTSRSLWEVLRPALPEILEGLARGERLIEVV